MCSPQSSDMDDVKSSATSGAPRLCSCAARHSGVQILTLGRLDSTGGLVDANRVSLSAEKIQQFPLITVAESNKGQTIWGPYDISFQLSVMTLLPADCCCKEKTLVRRKGRYLDSMSVRYLPWRVANVDSDSVVVLAINLSQVRSCRIAFAFSWGRSCPVNDGGVR